MSDEYITVESMIIFPNTVYSKIKARYIISAKTVLAVFSKGQTRQQHSYYMAVTDTQSVYNDFWNDALTDEQKVPAVSHMLNQLAQNNGVKFRYIQAIKISENGNV
jgi:hypothetical protein